MLEYKKDYKAWLYLGIPILLLSVFTFYPLVNTILVSLFSEYDNINHIYGGAFNLEAYKILGNRFFQAAIVNTLIIVFVSVPISTALALLIAVGLNSIKPLKKFFQIVFFTPYVTNVLAIGMVFAAMFSSPVIPGMGPNGLINTIFGLGNKSWVGINAERSEWMLVVLIYIIWNALPFKILVFIGGLQNISTQYYDAAKIDSAKPGKVLWRITIPLLSPIISYILITSFIGSFKTYESVLGVAGSVDTGLHYNRFTIVAFIYKRLEGVYVPGSISEYSQGAAAAVVLLGIILVFTMFNLYVSKKRVHY